MDIGYDGQWGYQMSLLSLANTGEPLYFFNRSGNRPSHEGAATFFDLAIALCRESGFRKITIRGDTDFSQTKYLDGWHEDHVRKDFARLPEGHIPAVTTQPSSLARESSTRGFHSHPFRLALEHQLCRTLPPSC